MIFLIMLRCAAGSAGLPATVRTATVSSAGSPNNVRSIIPNSCAYASNGWCAAGLSTTSTTARSAGHCAGAKRASRQCRYSKMPTFVRSSLPGHACGSVKCSGKATVRRRSAGQGRPRRRCR